ncbi:MAG: hypothetical protein E6I18_14090 [Chloroflexi bacterium]|nr:MAG: hypothetical protein E6I18_14090 [Chloroflexota bacterium]
MRRVLTSALLAALVCGCSVEAPEYRATPTPAQGTAVVTKPDVQAITYDVRPLFVRPDTTKTAIFFSNPNPFVLDWFMTVRLRAADGSALRDERIGNADVPPDRADPKFQNWYFPIPPGDSWTVVRFETAFAKSDVQEFKVARSLTTIGEVPGIRVASQACTGDTAVGVIGCDLGIETATSVPAFTRLHLVVVVRGTASPQPVLGFLQWRPELVATNKPWLSLAAGEKLSIQMHDSYPIPPVPWQFEVFAHAYQFSSQ